MTPKELYLELLEEFFKLNGWESKTPTQVNEHRTRAEQELFLMVASGIAEKEVGRILKELGIKSAGSFENFLEFPPFYIEAIRMLTLMQLSNDLGEFIEMNTKLKKNKPVKKEPNEFDKVLLALMKVPKSSLTQKKKGAK